MDIINEVRNEINNEASNEVIVKKKYPTKKCEHGNSKYYCIQCGGKGICSHGKRKNICKLCGGSRLCIHNREKHTCKECGGTSICEHNRRRSACKDCKGASICIHNHNKHTCKLCGGAKICVHNREKSSCKDCKGSAICEHNRRRQTCKECKGGSICIHNHNKHTCKLCGGKGICEHNREKNKCHDCGGSFCIHGRQKSRCYECGGCEMCEHKRERRRCKICKGNDICMHNKVKSFCKSCGGSSLCKSEWCDKTSIKKYNGYCMTCCIQLCPDIQISRNYKTKEKDVTDRIINAFPNFTWVADKQIQDGCSKKRPDLLLDLGSHIIIIEIDEHKHSNYDCSCENKRLMELSQDVGHRSIVFIRFNPDDFIDENGTKIKSCWKLTKQGALTIPSNKQTEWEQRIENLKVLIQYWIENPSEKTVEIIELYY